MQGVPDTLPGCWWPVGCRRARERTESPPPGCRRRWTSAVTLPQFWVIASVRFEGPDFLKSCHGRKPVKRTGSWSRSAPISPLVGNRNECSTTRIPFYYKHDRHLSFQIKRAVIRTRTANCKETWNLRSFSSNGQALVGPPHLQTALQAWSSRTELSKESLVGRSAFRQDETGCELPSGGRNYRH